MNTKIIFVLDRATGNIWKIFLSKTQLFNSFFPILYIVVVGVIDTIVKFLSNRL